MTALHFDTGPDLFTGAELLDQVRDVAMELVRALPRSPERLRIRAHGIEMELDWSAPESTDAPRPAPTSIMTVVPESPVETGIRVVAPTVGTFYRCPEPGAEPFVHVGDEVRAGQQVAIVEAMKLMLPVLAEVDGVVTDVLLEDGSPVEFGQALLTLDPRS